jgi:predicted transcriptional regulator of viral defense system
MDMIQFLGTYWYVPSYCIKGESVSTNAQKILDIVQKSGVIRPRDLKPYGISRASLYRLHQIGKLKRTGRGLYVLPDTEPTHHHTLAQVCKRMPNGIICLLTALQFHNLTTQQPCRVWIAVDRKAWIPKIPELPIQIVTFSGKALSEGVETHLSEGVTIKIYNIAKTVADCFKYRNKIGLDVAIEALRQCWQERRCSANDLWHYAKLCRVANVMRPYLEAIL